MCDNLIKIWNSLSDICKYDKTLCMKNISNTCRGLRESYAGYIWKYGELTTIVYKLNDNYEIVEEYENIKTLVNSNDYAESIIYKAIKNKVKTYGYFWIYKKDFMSDFYDNLSQIKNGIELDYFN